MWKPDAGCFKYVSSAWTNKKFCFFFYFSPQAKSFLLSLPNNKKLNHELIQKPALRGNQWSIHLLSLITHEAMHISASTCLGSVEKGKHLSSPSARSRSRSHCCLWRHNQHWNTWEGGGGVGATLTTGRENKGHRLPTPIPPPFHPAPPLLLVDLWPYVWRGWDKWKEWNSGGRAALGQLEESRRGSVSKSITATPLWHQVAAITLLVKLWIAMESKCNMVSL